MTASVKIELTTYEEFFPFFHMHVVEIEFGVTKIKLLD